MGTTVGITGTPGTGKKSIAPLLASILGLSSTPVPAHLRNVAPSAGGGGDEVDTARERRSILKHPPGRVVAYGHLLPYVAPPKLMARVIVLRCEPRILKGRLLRRGYSGPKTRANVEAELIGLIAADAYSAFGNSKTSEFDTTGRSPEESAKEIARAVLTKNLEAPRIDWTLNYGSARDLESLLSPTDDAGGLT